MLWGITTYSVNQWLDASSIAPEDITELKGFPASSGSVEGLARVIRSPEQLHELQDGEILVASTTSPSWTPIFHKIGAAITDVGGIMCHAAIVCREYGLPAVVGTGLASSTIKTGQKLRVDGDKGLITLLK
jgi:pyruvate,water dikinase